MGFAQASVVDEVCRREGGRILAGLIRRLGDFELAEEALQDAYAQALTTWPGAEVPRNPAAWLTTVALRKGLEIVRRRRTASRALDPLAEIAAREPEVAADDESGVADDQLRLIFTCCHPALAERAGAALALRTLCGLSTREIARAFIEPEATTAQRLVRAKRKIAEARIPYEIPHRDSLPERLESVLAVIYLVFNEGYAATEAAALVRPDLCAEAIRLGRLTVELLPDEAEAKGLLALMLLHDARRAARMGPDGELVPLEAQDRTRWRRDAIEEGAELLEATLRQRRPGPYQVEAAIAALHAKAPTAAETDWPQIAELYRILLRWKPSAVVELNAAVAVAMAEGIEAGLAWIDELERRGELSLYHLLHSARADLLRRAGRAGEARQAYLRARALVSNRTERAYIDRRLGELGPETAAR